MAVLYCRLAGSDVKIVLSFCMVPRKPNCLEPHRSFGMLMYTLPMSWPFRTLVVALLVIVGLGPQLACFMADQPAAASDMECCKEMIGACTAPNNSSQCCQVSAPTPFALAAKAVSHVVPRVEVVAATAAADLQWLFTADRQISRNIDTGPPDRNHESSSLVLRI